MKNIWKWILGIIIVLAILAVPFVMHYTFGINFTRGFGGRFPMMGGDAWNHPGMRDMHREWVGTEGFGMRGFGFFGPFMFLGGLLKLVFFGALIYGAYWLGRRNARFALDPAPMAPATPAVGVPPVEEPVSTPKRGRKVAKSE